jgi:hypothetical protein
MQKAGTANKKYVAGLPKLPAGVTVVYPTLKQQTDATATLGKLWGKLN